MNNEIIVDMLDGYSSSFLYCKSAIFEVGGYVMFITIVNEAYVDYGHIESQ